MSSDQHYLNPVKLEYLKNMVTNMAKLGGFYMGNQQVEKKELTEWLNAETERR